MQVDLKMQIDEEIPVKKVQDEQKRKQNCGNRSRITAQDSQFISQVSYLSQLSYFNLVEMKNVELCRENQHNIVKLTNKKSIKLSPEMKYFYCKKCELMLVPGESARVRTKSKRNKHVVVTCLNCNTFKRYVITNDKL